ncbi:BRE1 E3 ubiquitin ligase-domain-containing protein [Butyriboletus roseoflavus]|nr:BRE1 E3 ubiquitin ligase-domain-containing protein [Butyriboletus roseoflavus]
MESRKRPFTDDTELATQPKKRIVTSPGLGASPHSIANGTFDAVQEPTADDQLELFRKDALFRRMRHYARENEKSQARIAQLEQRKSTCEAGLVAIAACWEQLVDTIRTLTAQDDMPNVVIETKDLFDLSQHVSADSSLKIALEQNMHATQRLVTSFLKARPAVSHDATYQRCQKAQTECTALRSEVAAMRKRLEEVEADRARCQEELSAAETRIDRLKSTTVVAMQVQPSSLPKEESVMEDVQLGGGSPQAHPDSPPHTQLNGHDHLPPGDSEEFRDAMDNRDEQISSLEAENNRLTEEVTRLKIEVKAPSVEVISETPHYKLLLDHTSQLESALAEKTQEMTQLNETLDSLRGSRKEFEEEIQVAAQQVTQELKTLLSKRDADNLRVRELRDQYGAELSERKARDSVKLQSIHELKELAESRSERISQLQSEVARHKARLAALSGDEDLMKYFFEGKFEDLDYVRNLKRKLDEAQVKSAALEQALSAIDKDHPDVAQHITAETTAREELARTSKELARYRSIFGESSTPETRTLSQQLETKDGELQKLRLLTEQQAQAETSLFAEIDRLSSLWEGLDQQVKKKVFDLGAFEEKLQKTAHEKAKADNKYFAAMREKEMGESERKAMARQLEKQGKAVERAAEVEKQLSGQVADLEKMNVLSRRAIDNADKRIRTLEADASKWQMLVEAEKRRGAEACAFASERGVYMRKLESSLKVAAEEISRTRKEAGEKDQEDELSGRPREHAGGSPYSGKRRALENCEMHDVQTRNA